MNKVGEKVNARKESGQMRETKERRSGVQKEEGGDESMGVREDEQQRVETKEGVEGGQKRRREKEIVTRMTEKVNKRGKKERKYAADRSD